MISFIFTAIIAYLLGSVSSAIIVCKFLGLPDPRTQGSGNPGATNVMRIGGKNAAIITLIGDALKGLLAVLIGRLFGVEGFLLGIVGVAALLGHIYPIFFQFKGGKGVATAFGALLGMSLPVALVAAITWTLVIVFSRYSSLAALVTAVLAPVYTILFADFAYFFPVIIMSGIMIWRHWDNIQRLKTGTENKINL
ncbi:MAG: glycerol-3-phosphate 1-O-acyltransferase PlsY [Coxiellaceae bacterium]|nr:MAG: glycerol-3-phosphate 1-O-acyltransferase PlsY [Coxiellaceae bacterium]